MKNKESRSLRVAFCCDLDCRATRLRVKIKDTDKIDADILKQSGAAGVIKKGDGVQIVYGPRVTVIKSELEDYIESLKNKTKIEK